MKSLPLFYTNYAVPTYGSLRPLVGYVSHAGTPLGGWMYHGILFYNSQMYYTYPPTQTICNQWADGLMPAPPATGWLDLLNTVVGDLKTELGDPLYRLNVVLTTCYAPGYVHGNTDVNVQALIDRWSARAYAHLTLAGFYWGYLEAPGDGGSAICDVKYANDYIHNRNLGLKTVWIPYYRTWTDLTTRCSSDNTNWQQWGFDYVTAQPNYAFRCYLRTPTTFANVNLDLLPYGLAGVEFEISNTKTWPHPDPPNPGEQCTITIEQNAHAYLDAGSQYGWNRNVLNTFWYAPKYLPHYADGQANYPRDCGASYLECELPETFDRAIYDRVWQFIRGYHYIVINPNADATVRSATPS